MIVEPERELDFEVHRRGDHVVERIREHVHQGDLVIVDRRVSRSLVYRDADLVEFSPVEVREHAFGLVKHDPRLHYVLQLDEEVAILEVLNVLSVSRGYHDGERRDFFREPSEDVVDCGFLHILLIKIPRR